MVESAAFTISELSEATGVSVASIKFYLREQILRPGDPSRPHRAYYGPEHVERLQLIRILRDIGGLSVATIRGIVSGLDRKRAPTFRIIAEALNSLGEMARSDDDRPPSREATRALSDVDGFLASRGIRIGKESRARVGLAEALAAIRELSHVEVPAEALIPYADAARAIAEHETDTALLTGEPQTALRQAVLGTILWERVFVNLRRILHEHLAAEVYGKSGPLSGRSKPGAP